MSGGQETPLSAARPPEAPPSDRRRLAWRPDLAAESLRGRHAAARYADPVPMQISQATAPLRSSPEATKGYDTELLFGEIVDVYAMTEGWAWGQARRDGYVGYLAGAALRALGPAATHRVADLRAFLYAAPSIKTPPIAFLPYGAELAGDVHDERFLKTADGYICRAHLAPAGETIADPVDEAARFLGVPYLWGGKSSLGLDCSGLVQTVCHAAGIASPRDSDMQEAELGTPLAMPDDPAGVPRGALLFWPGHVAISLGGGRMIHANAFHMKVAIEEIAPALARIAGKGDPLRSVRMLPRPA